MYKKLQKFLEKSAKINEYFDNIRSHKNMGVFGLNLGEKTMLSSLVEGSILYVTHSAESCEEIAENLSKLGRNVATITNANTIFTFHNKEFGNLQKLRQTSLYSLVNCTVDALVINGEVLCEKFVTPKKFKESIITFKKNQDLEPEKLLNLLIQSGYERVQQVETGGQFARRGDVVDIFPINSKLPFRLYYFDTQIEKINSFNVLSQYAVNEVEELQLCPNGFFITESEFKTLTNEVDKSISEASKLAKNSATPNDFLHNLQMLTSYKDTLAFGLTLSNWGFFSPWFQGSSILDYLPNCTIFIDQPKQVANSIFDYLELIESSIIDAISSGQLFAKHKSLILDFDDIKNNIESNTKVAFQSIMTANKFFDANAVVSIDTIPLPNIAGKWQEPSQELDRLLNDGYNLLLACLDTFDGMEMQKTLQKMGKKVQFCNKIEEILPNQYNIMQLGILNGVGFFDAKFVLLGREQLRFRRELTAGTDKRKKSMQEEFSIPEIGEYVVHAVHGIGVCEGVTQLTVNNAVRDYLVITYKNNDKLYVPTEQMDLLSRYIGAEKKPSLNILGGVQFEKIKEKVRNSIKKLAFDLLALYREREQSKGIKMKVPDDMYNEFDATFRYDLTKDQARSINEVRQDLASGKIMDRLVVGDVGYGKTEVALRAVFIAVMTGHQVAILAPTTILSEQHYNTFLSRLGGFGIEVRCLNRFRTVKEQKAILKDLESGKVNVICGTHRLLSKDVKFFDLALLVLDEEQRFGVNDKEKIKNIKKNIHVLTLSATPIPRTLHMSLVGIRDISIIETPPVDRLPVQTVVAQFNNNLLTTAIKREIERGGQVLIVYPRVETIEDFASRVHSLIDKNITIGVAHGQMYKNKLEDIMLKVYRGEVNILIATSLIENGIDLPNANTMFVVKADLFGLSQLYQLRGRVGRSNKLAWAYFTYMDETSLSETSYLRLSTLLEFTQLGSGFKIAMRDLEMRGAGNLLGGEQHGQLEKVGYDMYCKLLNSEVSTLRGEQLINYRGVKIEVDWDAFIPAKFCSDDTERMELYSMIASISTVEDFNDILIRIKDRWGALPKSIEGLCRVALLKSSCVRMGVERAVVTSKKVTLSIALDNDNKADELMAKITTKMDIKVYKKDNWAIFEFDKDNLGLGTYNKVIKFLN